MLLSIAPNIAVVRASTNQDLNNTEIDTNSIEEEIEQDFGVNVSEELTFNVKEYQNTVVVDTTLVTEDINVLTEVEYNLEAETILLNGIVEEDGKETNENFEVIVHEVEGENFSATFIDQNTGEIYDMNTIEAQASAVPLVIVAAVARYGITYAIKKYGKKAATNAVKSKSYGQVLSSVSKLDKNKRDHIMQAKHDWHKVTNNNWTDISKVISHVMRNGKESAYKSVRKKTLNMNGETVTVTFTRVKGEIKISDAWVNK